MVFVFLLFCAGSVLIWLGKDFIRVISNADFIVPLVLYLFFFLNLDFLESYWLAKKRTDYVLYYSTARVTLRMLVVIGTAYYTQDVRLIIYSVVAVEGIKFTLVLLFTLKQRILTNHLQVESIKQQLVFFVPLGITGIVAALSGNVGKLFISAQLGAVALAFYVIGTYISPIINIVRNSISDVIFPEMVGKKTGQPKIALELWQRATVMNCVLLFPVAFVLFYYADVIVVTLFTEAYADAIPIFQIYVFALIRESFNLVLPLRVLNKTTYILASSMVVLIVNIGLVVVLFKLLGFIGPALAHMTAGIIASVYLGSQVMRFSKFSLAEMVPWHQIGIVLLACIVSLPILFLGEHIAMSGLLRAILFSTLYALIYLQFVRYAGVREVNLILGRFATHLRRL
jgi:O-antigen/teichoic acid export membrane protein